MPSPHESDGAGDGAGRMLDEVGAARGQCHVEQVGLEVRGPMKTKIHERLDTLHARQLIEEDADVWHHHVELQPSLRSRRAQRLDDLNDGLVSPFGMDGRSLGLHEQDGGVDAQEPMLWGFHGLGLVRRYHPVLKLEIPHSQLHCHTAALVPVSIHKRQPRDGKRGLQQELVQVLAAQLLDEGIRFPITHGVPPRAERGIEAGHDG
mmetsp:Transcript_4712/g.10449  ORF Transcript_4712/g.10449 Transcript_4712/m.10449 type:complete len:206 (+) Transcript_4712:121-738(+)